MRILFVAFPLSIHAARWINQIADQKWDLHFAASVPQHFTPHLTQEVKRYNYHQVNMKFRRPKQLAIKLLARWPHHRGSGHARRLQQRLADQISAKQLSQLIFQLRPDIVHSMEMQHAAYRTLAAKEQMNANFPTWIMSNWGSDIHLYHRIAAHQDAIQRVLAHCDYYACECQRDVELAKSLGLRGKVLPTIPCGGGFNLATFQRLRLPGPTSERNVILLKGYQNWAGRALVGLRAIELCADLIRVRGFSVHIYLASDDVQIAAELVAHATGLPIVIEPYVEYEDAIRRFGRARIHLGLSISDGISQSLLESMVMGAFPIQSCTSCANEWIEDGKSGLIVPPEDPQVIAAALRRALTDDEFVDQAVAINDETARQRLAASVIKQQMIEIYKSVYAAATDRA